ncbi:MAG: hypothetical protein GY729_03875 [Desulfobacteraceae bacterium]|nr:hypothetical protein [Desulfobacteraceae bacterium]
MQNVMGDFQFDGRMMRYSEFVPRLYNMCKSYGFEPGRIMPSRAFCSDENQGFPIILITKHFGAFPFNHGMVGGIVATDRHGPHAHHGKDLVIIQASHVGYDPETENFGVYRRLQMDSSVHTASCGKIDAVLEWYQQEYQFAKKNILFTLMDSEAVVIIDNQFLDTKREKGLFLALDRIVDMGKTNRLEPLYVLSTSKAFRIHPDYKAKLPHSLWKSISRVPISEQMTADLFYFKQKVSKTVEGRDQLERNLGRYMPQIVTASFPALTAALANTQIEFDRTYRTLLKEPGYQGKNLAFIAGINIDISPQKGQLFPLTKFVPWAAYVQTRDGKQFILEQKEIVEALKAQSSVNPERIELSKAIQIMEKTSEIKIAFPSS